MARKRLWTTSGRASVADLEIYTRLFARYGSKGLATRSRVVSDFKFWTRSQSLGYSRGLQFFVGSLLRAGLRIGTIKTYVSYIMYAIPGMLSDPLSLSVRRTVALAHADAAIREARRLSYADVERLLLRIKDPELRRVIIFLTYTGLRLADLQKLRRQSFLACPDANRVLVRIKISKGRRSASKAKTLRLEPFTKIFRGRPMPAVFTEFMSGNPDDRPFANISVSQVNAAFEKNTLWPGERSATTYSLRKLYMSTILAYFNWDIAKASELSLHVQSDTLAAYYDTCLL